MNLEKVYQQVLEMREIVSQILQEDNLPDKFVETDRLQHQLAGIGLELNYVLTKLIEYQQGDFSHGYYISRK